MAGMFVYSRQRRKPPGKQVPTVDRRHPSYTTPEGERDYTDEELRYMKAMDDYKTTHRRPFPTVCEYLAVLKSLGYHL